MPAIASRVSSPQSFCHFLVMRTIYARMSKRPAALIKWERAERPSPGNPTGVNGGPLAGWAIH